MKMYMAMRMLVISLTVVLQASLVSSQMCRSQFANVVTSLYQECF